jgi:alpha-galactosidase
LQHDLVDRCYPGIGDQVGGYAATRAALDGSRNHVYQAALLDPNTSAALTTAQTVAICDELFDAHQRLLPPVLRR